MISRLLGLLRLGRISLTDDTGPVRLLQIDEGSLPNGRQVLNKVPHVQHFGHAAVPPLASDAVLAAPGGDRSQTMVVGTNHPASRPRNLKPGDSTLYDVRGAIVQLTEAGLLIDCAGLPAVIRNYTTLIAEGDLHVAGDVISRSSGTPVSLNALRDAYDAHKHTGVSAGSASSGPTDQAV